MAGRFTCHLCSAALLSFPVFCIAHGDRFIHVSSVRNSNFGSITRDSRMLPTMDLGEALGTELDGRECEVKAFLDGAAGARGTLASRTMQRPSVGTGHRPLHFHASRMLGAFVHVSHLLPLHSVPLPRKRSNLGGSAC